MTLNVDHSDALEFDLLPAGSTGVVYYGRILRALDVAARDVFSHVTPSTLLISVGDYPQARAEWSPRTAPVASIDPEVVSTFAHAPILRAVDELRTWLNVSYDNLAKLFGWRSASILHHWRKRAREGEAVRPRATTVEPILRLHAVLRAVGDAVSGDDSPAPIQLWARTPVARGGLTPLELLERHDIEQVERAAGRLVFEQTPANRRPWRVAQLAGNEELPRPTRPPRYSPEDFG